MVIHFQDFLGESTRSIETKIFRGQEMRVLTIRRPFETNQDNLWSLLTTAEKISKWFLPVSGELKIGGKYQFEGNAGGTVEECNAPDSFLATWEFGGQVSWVLVSLEGHENTTDFLLEHMAMVPEEMWQEYGPGAVGIGWESGLLGLYLHLQTGNANDPAEGMAWMLSPNGVDFVTECSRLWAWASIEHGTSEAHARAAAERSTDIYTGKA